MRTVVGLFDNPTEAQRTIQELVQLGYAPENISIVTGLGSQRMLESGTRMNLSAMECNDVGRVAATGPLREALRAQKGTDAALAATLRRSGLSTELAERYATGVRQGETLESIMVNDQEADNVVAVMKRHSQVPEEPGGAKAQRVGALPVEKLEKEREKIPRERERETHRFGDKEERTIPLVREELQVGKREIETGTVRVKVHVVERPVSGEVNLREEHVEIERRPVDRALRGDENLFREDQIEMREYAEKPLVSKQARVVEEVVVHKTIREHVERIDDSVRNTEIQFEGPFDATAYKKHFDQMAVKDATFEEYAPAYKLGRDLKSDTRLRGSRWEEIEPRIREHWETKSPGTWTKFKESIRHAFSRD